MLSSELLNFSYGRHCRGIGFLMTAARGEPLSTPLSFSEGLPDVDLRPPKRWGKKGAGCGGAMKQSRWRIATLMLGPLRLAGASPSQGKFEVGGSIACRLHDHANPQEPPCRCDPSYDRPGLGPPLPFHHPVRKHSMAFAPSATSLARRALARHEGALNRRGFAVLSHSWTGGSFFVRKTSLKYICISLLNQMSLSEVASVPAGRQRFVSGTWPHWSSRHAKT